MAGLPKAARCDPRPLPEMARCGQIVNRMRTSTLNQTLAHLGTADPRFTYYSRRRHTARADGLSLRQRTAWRSRGHCPRVVCQVFPLRRAGLSNANKQTQSAGPVQSATGPAVAPGGGPPEALSAPLPPVSQHRAMLKRRSYIGLPTVSLPKPPSDPLQPPSAVGCPEGRSCTKESWTW